MRQNYKILNLSLFWFALFSAHGVLAQSHTVSGKVTSSEDGAPIPGVNIIVKNTVTGAVTDVDGNYSINVQQDAVLVFSSIGYATKEEPVAGRSVIDPVVRNRAGLGDAALGPHS